MNVAALRLCLTQGRFEFSRHALKRAVERNISDAEIREAGARLEILEDYPNDKYSPSCLGLGFSNKDRPIHLQVCYSEPETLKIITLYEPDPVEWLDFKTRRIS